MPSSYKQLSVFPDWIATDEHACSLLNCGIFLVATHSLFLQLGEMPLMALFEEEGDCEFPW